MQLRRQVLVPHAVQVNIKQVLARRPASAASREPSWQRRAQRRHQAAAFALPGNTRPWQRLHVRVAVVEPIKQVRDREAATAAQLVSTCRRRAQRHRQHVSIASQASIQRQRHLHV